MDALRSSRYRWHILAAVGVLSGTGILLFGTMLFQEGRHHRTEGRRTRGITLMNLAYILWVLGGLLFFASLIPVLWNFTKTFNEPLKSQRERLLDAVRGIRTRA